MRLSARFASQSISNNYTVGAPRFDSWAVPGPCAHQTMTEYERVTIAIDKDLHRELYDAKPYGQTLQEFTERLLLEGLTNDR